jgi:hypothetical protein
MMIWKGLGSKPSWPNGATILVNCDKYFRGSLHLQGSMILSRVRVAIDGSGLVIGFLAFL